MPIWARYLLRRKVNRLLILFGWKHASSIAVNKRKFSHVNSSCCAYSREMYGICSGDKLLANSSAWSQCSKSRLIWPKTNTPTHSQTTKQTNEKQTNQQTTKQTNKTSNKQPNKQSKKQTGRRTNKQTKKPYVKQTNRQTNTNLLIENSAQSWRLSLQHSDSHQQSNFGRYWDTQNDRLSRRLLHKVRAWRNRRRRGE